MKNDEQTIKYFFEGKAKPDVKHIKITISVSVLCEWLFDRHKVTLELPVCISFVWGQKCLGMRNEQWLHDHTLSLLPNGSVRLLETKFWLFSLVLSSSSRTLLETDREHCNFSLIIKNPRLVLFVDCQLRALALGLKTFRSLNMKLKAKSVALQTQEMKKKGNKLQIGLIFLWGKVKFSQWHCWNSREVEFRNWSWPKHG